MTGILTVVYPAQQKSLAAVKTFILATTYTGNVGHRECE